MWQDVVATYLEKKSNTKLEQLNHTNFKTQCLFSNDLIGYKGTVLFFTKWRNKGIETMKDVIHPNVKRLLSLAETRALLGQNSTNQIFEYNALVNSIPKQWFEWLREEDHDVYVRPTCEPKLCYVKPKQIKKILITNRKSIVPTACHFWQKNFGFISKEKVWYAAWKTTKETKLRVLQWKSSLIYIQQIFGLMK